MIIITDCHVNPAKGNDRAFFMMLEALEKNDQDLIFLGDIFDLWIALSRYEEDIHKKFLAWCRSQKKQRTIGFVEGNHEFFLSEERNCYFSWCSNGSAWQDQSGNLFCHGDQINREDQNYLRFRKLARNKISKALLRLLPWGPKLVHHIKQQLKKTNQDFRTHLPQAQIEAYAERQFSGKGVRNIFIGHFHHVYTYQNPKAHKLYALPDWETTQRVTFYSADRNQISFPRWQALKNVSRPLIK
jgi:UDP-2,3-diacylglucosamine pyrophosphatase LpxH